MKKINIFTFLIAILTFAVVLRLTDIAHFATQVSVAENTAAPQAFKTVDEQPPPDIKPGEGTAAKEKEPDAGEKDKTTPAAHAPADAVPAPYGEKAFSAAEVDVLQSLSQRRAALDKREEQMGQRAALLKAAEGEVDRKIAELNKIRGELEALLNKQQTIQGDRVASLVKIYEGMKPKEAARIFDTLEMDVLMAVIGKMSERKSSPILASMNPEKARLLTIKLTAQHKLPDMVEQGKAADAPPQ